MTKKDAVTVEETMVQRLLRYLAAEEVLAAKERDPTKHQTAIRTVVLLASELRKAQKEERQSADELSEAPVVEWFRRIDAQRQGRLVRELQEVMAAAKRSGLA